MEALSRMRRAAIALAARELGKDPRQPRLTVSQGRFDGLEADIDALPVAAGPWAPLQFDDGTFKFVLGVSALGGPDKLA